MGVVREWGFHYWGSLKFPKEYSYGHSMTGLLCILRSRIHQFYIDGFIASTFLLECPGLPLSILRPTNGETRTLSNHSDLGAPDLREDAFNHRQVQKFIGKTRMVVTPHNAAIYIYASGKRTTLPKHTRVSYGRTTRKEGH